MRDRYKHLVIIISMVLTFVLLTIECAYPQSLQDPEPIKMNPLTWSVLLMISLGLFALAGIVREFVEPFNELREQKKYLRKCREWRRKYKNDKQENE